MTAAEVKAQRLSELPYLLLAFVFAFISVPVLAQSSAPPPSSADKQASSVNATVTSSVPPAVKTIKTWGEGAGHIGTVQGAKSDMIGGMAKLVDDANELNKLNKVKNVAGNAAVGMAVINYGAKGYEIYDQYSRGNNRTATKQAMGTAVEVCIDVACGYTGFASTACSLAVNAAAEYANKCIAEKYGRDTQDIVLDTTENWTGISVRDKDYSVNSGAATGSSALRSQFDNAKSANVDYATSLPEPSYQDNIYENSNIDLTNSILTGVMLGNTLQNSSGYSTPVRSGGPAVKSDAAHHSSGNQTEGGGNYNHQCIPSNDNCGCKCAK